MNKAAVLAQLKQAGSDSRHRDRVCAEVASALVAVGVEPDFDVTTGDFADDAALICADRYWQLRLIDQPGIATAARCARWLENHVAAPVRHQIEHRWALGNGFVTRSSVESPAELAEATAALLAAPATSETVALFAALYHAGKLRANRAFDALRMFLDASPLLEAAGARREDPAVTALRSLAAFGSRAMTTDYAIRLLDVAWRAPDRTREVVDVCVQGISDAVPFDGQGVLLTERASEAVAAYQAGADHIFRYRLACGLHLCHRPDEALVAIDEALNLLPAIGGRVSHELLQQQYLTKREAILEGRLRAQWSAEQRGRWEAQERANAAIQSTLQSSTVRAVELVAIFTAAIAFAVGSLQVTLNGNLHLRDRIWLVVALGVGLAVFALLTIGGTWYLTSRPSGSSHTGPSRRAHGPDVGA
ncbi:hypothetical protein [Catenulispora rubra]|uniref:hypothetical protein n=1 Tax=Catenulispora rubra TaxID=280293 RepID=UPI0018927748|nr:hypothetical protein [Catenulispora rubra]